MVMRNNINRIWVNAVINLPQTNWHWGKHEGLKNLIDHYLGQALDVLNIATANLPKMYHVMFK